MIEVGELSSLTCVVRVRRGFFLQELYFAGYAFWNYFTTPFLLAQPGVEVEEIEPHKEDGETWRPPSVIFPPEIPTHSAHQTFYFNDKGLLQRHDYATDVAGAVASHYCLTMSHSTTSLSQLSAAWSNAEPTAPLSMVRPRC